MSTLDIISLVSIRLQIYMHPSSIDTYIVSIVFLSLHSKLSHHACLCTHVQICIYKHEQGLHLLDNLQIVCKNNKRAQKRWKYVYSSICSV